MGRLIDEDEALFVLTTSCYPQSMEYTLAYGIARKLIKTLPTASIWNPVEEPLPITEVICADEYNNILIGYIGKTDEGYIAESEDGAVMYDPIYWMRKPVIPQKWEKQ